jgi:hypothetical protein
MKKSLSVLAYMDSEEIYILILKYAKMGFTPKMIKDHFNHLTDIYFDNYGPKIRKKKERNELDHILDRVHAIQNNPTITADSLIPLGVQKIFDEYKEPK